MGDQSFQGCVSLKELVLPSISFAGNKSFMDCSKLEYLGLPKIVEPNGLGKDSFVGMENIRYIDLQSYFMGKDDDDQTELPEGLFNGLDNLRCINLGSMNKVLIQDKRWDYLGIHPDCQVIAKNDEGETEIVSYDDEDEFEPRSFLRYNGNNRLI